MLLFVFVVGWVSWGLKRFESDLKYVFIGIFFSFWEVGNLALHNWLVNNSAFVIYWVISVTKDTFYIIWPCFSRATSRLLVSCTFDTFWSTVAIGFSMTILLAVCALGNCTLWSRWLKYNLAMHKIFNIVNMLINGVWKKLYHK